MSSRSITFSRLAGLVAADQLQADPANRIRVHVGVLARSGLADIAPCARLVYVVAKFLERRNRRRQLVDQHADVLSPLRTMFVQKLRIAIRRPRRPPNPPVPAPPRSLKSA